MTQIPMFGSDLLSVGKAATALHTSRWAVYRWIKAGKLHGIRIGGFLFVPLSEIKRFNNDHHGKNTERR